MKNIKIFSIDMLIIILSGLLLGFLFGSFCPVNIKMQVRTFYNDIYIKLHPESQMDTQTIIINRATKNNLVLPKNNIFEPIKKKENPIVIFIKNIFTPSNKNTNSPVTINDNNSKIISQE